LTVDPVARLGQLLRDVGFSGDPHKALIAGGLPPAAILTRLGRARDARLATLASLFDGEQTVAPAQAADALDPIGIAELVDAGLLESDGDGIRATTRLLVLGDVIVAGDPLRESSRPDYVVGLSSASVRMAGTTLRRPVETALDLGTGAGIQALLAARHSQRVVAIDVNRRALDFAGWSARLNGVDNVEWVEGEWFAPVRGRRFDLVIATGPVIISPETEMLWRDSPRGGEELSRLLVTECAEHLTEGGVATVCCHWTHAEGAWSELPVEWATNIGCDAVVLLYSSQEPLQYALNNVIDRPDPDRTAVGDVAKRWMGHYRRAGTERIATGTVVLRRRAAGANWVRAFHLGDVSTTDASDHLERIFAAGDALAERSGADGLAWLMASTWRPLAGDRIDQTLLHADGAYGAPGAMLRRDPGMGLGAWLDPRVVPAVVGCDGRRSLAQVLGETPVPAGVEQAEFRGLCLATIRELIARGLLVREAV